MTEEHTANKLDLEARIRLIQSHDDFPALSNTISEINEVVSSDTSSIQSLTSIILEDFSLTNNLLKVVNTVSYGQFGGKISTISKAVVILGFDVVRNIATALILLDFLENKSQSEQISDKVIAAYFVGLTSRQLTINQQASNYEEAMICGIFHHLGHLLSIFYFYEESQKVNQLIAEGISEHEASRTILGVSYDSLGVEVAKIWKLPQQILHGMQGLPDNKIKESSNEYSQLKLTVNLASELAAIAASDKKQDKHKSIQLLVTKYKKALQVDIASLQKVLEESLKEVSARGNIVKLAAKNSQWLQRVTDYTNGSITKIDKPFDLATKAQSTPIEQRGAIEDDAQTPANKESGESILEAGIHDVINTLIGDFNLNDVLQMILETMYRGLQCHRVMLFIRDNKTQSMRARSGYGANIDKALPLFKFSLDYAADIFHLSVEKGADIVIADTRAESVTSKIPQWYKEGSTANSFLLLPIMIKEKAVGCFYADTETTHGFDETSKELSLLRTLRNQAVLAIKQH
ncbi:MAG: HDOD domain-containing protein [Methylophilaceae bacterium]